MSTSDIVLWSLVGVWLVLSALWTWFCFKPGDYPAGWL